MADREERRAESQQRAKILVAIAIYLGLLWGLQRLALGREPRVDAARQEPPVDAARQEPRVDAARQEPRPPVARPEPGVTLRGRVVEVYDGDTLTVEIRIPMRVRLLDCWAPEVRGNERPAGERSRDALRDLALGKEALLHVPTADATRLDGVFTFGRVLGYVWIAGELHDVSSQMVERGFATSKKKP